jgi:hypothetical protein
MSMAMRRRSELYKHFLRAWPSPYRDLLPNRRRSSTLLCLFPVT